MKLRAVILATLLASLASTPARAQDNPLPQGTIVIALPFVAGGPLDGVARVLSERLGQKLNRTFVVENRPGAGGEVAAASVAKAPADGRLWLFATDSVFTIVPHMNPNRTYDPAALLPLAKVGETLLLLGVNAEKVPAKTFAELVAFSRTKELSFGSAGLGSPGHMAFEYLRAVSDIKGVHVPYRGAALAMQDLISGQIDASFIVSGVLVPHVKKGTLRALAVSANRRIAALPDVPTAAEAGMKDFEARFANLLLLSAATPPALASYVEREVLAIAREPEFAQRIAAFSTEAENGDRKHAADWIVRERERWGKVIAKPK